MSTRKPVTEVTIVSEPVVQVQTATSLQHENNQEVRNKEKQRTALIDIYKAEETVGVSGSPMYAPYFGRVMPISLNGIYISVPLDGRKYDIPKPFADMFYTRLRSVDSDLDLQKKLGDVTKNQETYAGELDLVRLSQ